MKLIKQLQTYYLSEVVNFKNGSNKYSNEYIKNHPGKYPVFSSRIKNDGILGYIDHYDYDGDYVYYTTHGYAGNVHLKENMKFSLTYGCIVKPKDLNQLTLKYLFFYLKAYQKRIQNLKNGSAILIVSKNNLKYFPIKIPHLNDQKQIVNEIQKIEVDMYQLNVILKQLKQFEKKFLNYHFNNLENYHFVKLGTLVRFKKGLVKYNKAYLKKHPGKYPLLSARTKNNGILGYIDHYDYDGDYVYYTTDGAYAGNISFKKNTKFSITSHAALILVKNPYQLNLKYLYYFLKSKQSKIWTFQNGSAQPMITKNIFNNFEIKIVDHQLQTQIVNVIEPIENRITNLITKITNLKQNYENYQSKIIKGIIYQKN